MEQVDKGASMLLVIMDEAGRLHAIACTHAPKDARTEQVDGQDNTLSDGLVY